MKRMIILIAAGLLALVAKAQEDTLAYHPLAVEGRMWYCSRIVPWIQEWPKQTHFYSYIIVGDTIVGGICYKKLYRNDYTYPYDKDDPEWWLGEFGDEGYIDNDWHYVAAIRDDGPRAYILRDGKAEEEMIYDVSLEKGNVVDFNKKTIKVDLAYSINSHNLTLQKLGIYWENVSYPASFADYHVYWIESVGWDIDFFFPDGNIRSIYKGHSNVLAVFDDDVCIYGDPNIKAPTDNQSDTYHPFIEEGREWIVGQPAGDQVMNLERYYFDGDTIVAGQPAKRWMCEKTEESGTQTSYIGALYEEGRRVYIALPNKEAVTPGSLSNTWYLRGYSSGGKYIPVGAGKGDGRWLISINEEEQKMEGRSGPNEMIANVSVDGTLIRITDLYSTQVGDMNPISDLFTARLSSVASFSISEDGSLRLSDESDDYLELVTTPIYLLYDFAAGVGDTVEMYDHLSLQNTTCVIKERETVSSDHYKGVRTDVAMYDYGLRGTTLPGEEDYFYYGCWFEGIGSYRRPITNSDYLDGYLCNLLVCKVGDEIIYHDPDWSPVGLDPAVKKQWLDFTHTVKTRPKSPRRRGSGQWTMESGQWTMDRSAQRAATSSDSESEEGNLTGEYSDAELLVSLVPLKGPYTVTLTNADGEEVYAKTVQTSSVVALNTDLSCYPDGPYTLVVENADEAYTAALSIGEGNGIKGIGQSDNLQFDKGHSSIFNPHSSIYYDLSGRRLSAPPAKGMYIQDKRVKIRE